MEIVLVIIIVALLIRLIWLVREIMKLEDRYVQLYNALQTKISKEQLSDLILEDEMFKNILESKMNKPKGSSGVDKWL